MTKEELEHDHIKEIAENYVNESWGSYLDLSEVDLVMAGIGVAKIISKEKEKRIAELEQEKCELLGIIQGKDVAIKDLQDNYENFKAIAIPERENLQKKNAELKKKNLYIQSL